MPFSYISTLVTFPFITGVFILFFPITPLHSKRISLLVTIVCFYLSILIWVLFDYSNDTFQFVETFSWYPSSNVILSFGIDGISLMFILLTAFLMPICLLSSWSSIKKKNNFFAEHHFFALFLILESFIFVVFSSLDLIVFYSFFEAVLMPMFLIIGIWGSRERKIRAAYLFFIYTLFGSLLMLLGILFIYLECGSTHYIILVENSFSPEKQKYLWLAFFFSFAVKVPIFPVHLWLPEAHVEAPTAGSVLLAGILLKLGTYGIIRYSLPLFPLASVFFRPFVFALGSVAIIYTSITAIRQSDIKRVIAYASVAHINITVLGLFSFNLVGFEGAIFQMLSHGVVSGALFLCVGVLYDRHHSRLIKYYGGLVHTIPLFITLFLFFTIANIALPGTSSFVGEFLILFGTFYANSFTAFAAGSSIVLSSAYSLWLFNRLSYGNVKSQFINISFDITKREFYCFFPLVFLTLVGGIYPNIFLKSLHSCSAGLLCSFILSNDFNLY
ncbi:MAG: NADH-quinone oxidoreductase subunit M [Phycisphaerae bacterium]|nr:NADH-quinone oxidoreductase subunit M [Phycisphaerae bacterium]|tara:strand:- start:1040 stop:2539 length:1500 start_codon:yes stop_codon:yes gene_type:complete